METLFVSLFKEYGVLPTLLILIVILWFLVREIKNEFKTINSSLKSEINSLKSELEKFKKTSDERDDKLTEMINMLRDRIASIEKEYVSRNDHYRDLGGWRMEVKEIRDLILTYMEKNNENSAKGKTA